MKYMAKYFHVCWDDDVKPIQKQCQQTLYTGELCSIRPYVLNNSTKIQNVSNFQQQTREALQNSQIDEAFELVRKYVGV